MSWVAIDFETANETRGSACALGVTIVEDGQVVERGSCRLTPQTGRFDLDHPFFGATVVFTGTLQSMVRRDAMQHVLNLGGRCATSVSENTNFLVVGDQDFRKFTDGISSSKMKAAQRLRAAGGDIELIVEDDFLRMLEPVAFAV